MPLLQPLFYLSKEHLQLINRICENQKSFYSCIAIFSTLR